MDTQHFILTPTNNDYYKENHSIYLNGSFFPANEVVSDLFGQTLHYGYGAFEGIRAYSTASGAKVFKAKEHYDRLKKSCELLSIPFNYSIDELIEATYELLKQNDFTNAYIRPLVFCSPKMPLDKPNEVSIMICAWEWGAYLGDKLINLTFSSYCRPHPKSIKIEAKACGHYVNSILATIEAKTNGYDEAILLDTEGFLAEGPGANLFFEKDNKLFTPQLGNILPGITRATMLELSKKLNITVEEGLYSPEMLENADSAFLCGTAVEVIGVKALNNKEFPLQWENSIGKKLQTAYNNLVLDK